jgi:hypothetical protein
MSSSLLSLSIFVVCYTKYKAFAVSLIGPYFDPAHLLNRCSRNSFGIRYLTLQQEYNSQPYYKIPVG